MAEAPAPADIWKRVQVILGIVLAVGTVSGGIGGYFVLQYRVEALEKIVNPDAVAAYARDMESLKSRLETAERVNTAQWESIRRSRER